MWYVIFKCLGLIEVFPRNHRSLFEIFISLSGRSRDRGEVVMILHSVMWNDIMLSSPSTNVKDIEESGIFLA